MPGLRASQSHLYDFVGVYKDMLRSCVCAVRLYIKTQQVRPVYKHLFILTGHVKVSKNTISWLLKVISWAHGPTIDLECKAARLNVHEVHSTMCVLQRKFIVDQVFHTGILKYHSMFAAFFVRDFTYKLIDISIVSMVPVQHAV